MHKSSGAARLASKTRGMRVIKGDLLSLYIESGSGNLNIYGENIPPHYPHPPTQNFFQPKGWP